MTIDSTWVEILKKNHPSAFTLEPPFIPECVFIDGMLSLMRGKHIRSWDRLVDFNFCRHIRKYMDMGVTTVIVGFDVYAYVPMAKSITQANRSKAKASVDFTQEMHLPPMIPDNYEDCMGNRTFKVKVIAKVVEEIEGTLNLPTGKRLIIDYQGYPVVTERFYKDSDKGKKQRPELHRYLIEDVPEMGECDIKAFRWADMLGDMFAHSKDGDYIPIALLHHERALRNGGKPPRIAVVRGEYVMPALASTKKKSVQSNTLDTIFSRQVSVANDGGDDDDDDGKVAKKRLEYVNVAELYDCLHKFIRSQTIPADVQAQCSLRSRTYMQMMTILIGLGGTDFSRTLPRVGPKTLWKIVTDDPVIFSELLLSISPDHATATAFDVDRVADKVIAKVLAKVFQKHISCSSSNQNLASVMRQIKSSPSMSDKIRQALDCESRIKCTLRNILWMCEYWCCREPVSGANEGEWDRLGACPCPISDMYGFVSVRGKIKWADESN